MTKLKMLLCQGKRVLQIIRNVIYQQTFILTFYTKILEGSIYQTLIFFKYTKYLFKFIFKKSKFTNALYGNITIFYIIWLKLFKQFILYDADIKKKFSQRFCVSIKRKGGKAFHAVCTTKNVFKRRKQNIIHLYVHKI